MRMPVLKIALPVVASVALGSAAIAEVWVGRGGAHVVGGGAHVVTGGAHGSGVGFRVNNGHFRGGHFGRGFYGRRNGGSYWGAGYGWGPSDVGYGELYYDHGYNDRPYNDQSYNEPYYDDRNYPTAAVCRTQRVPWRHGNYSVHVCYGNVPVL